jgi:hypothetical protein
MLMLAKRASERNEWFWMVLAIVIYSIFFGLRYGVGDDHISYLSDYLRYGLASSGQYDETEIGFKFFRDTLAQNDIHFSVYFAIIAFVQLWLVFKAVQKDKFIYPYLVVAFFLGCIWLSYSNGLRQQLAFCFFAYSLLFIENKKQLPIHYLLLLLAYSMHDSAAILFAFAPLLLLKAEWFSRVKFQIPLVLVAIAIGSLPHMEDWIMSTEGKLGILSDFMEETGYDDYYEFEDGEEMFMKGGSLGIGYYVNLVLNMLIVWYSNKVKHNNESNKVVTYMYNFAFLGIVFHYLFISSHIISRVNYYFYGFVYIFGAYTLHYLYHNNRKMFWVMLALYVLVFVGTLHRMYDNTSAFYFFWQEDLYGM